MAVTIDIGEWNDIHPLNKKDVGLRLALQARKIVYGEKIVSDGPVYQSHVFEGNKIILSFKEGTDNFRPVNELKGFAIAGADGIFKPALAAINEKRIVVWNDEISQPVMVRYAWANNPEGANLYNREGLPASPFQSLPSEPMLPDPFKFSDGSGRVTTMAEWTRRRAEIKAEIEYYEIGVTPERPVDIKATFVDDTLKVFVTDRGKTITFVSKAIVPQGEGPFPVVIGMNRPTGSLPAELFDECIQIPFIHNQVAMYGRDAKKSDGAFFQMYPELSTNGDYSAWSWGISRLIEH
jgi:hypothetical protein